MKPLFRTGFDYLAKGSIIEAPAANEIYVNYIAHDATTLTPKFNRVFPSQTTSTNDYGPGFNFAKAMNIQTATPGLDFFASSQQGYFSQFYVDQTVYPNTYLLHSLFSQHIFEVGSNSLINSRTATLQETYPVNFTSGADVRYGLATNRRTTVQSAGLFSITSAGATSYIGTVDTATGSVVNSATHGLIYEDSNRIIFAMTRTGSAGTTVKQVLKSTLACTELAVLADEAATNRAWGMFSKPITIGDFVYVYCVGENNNRIQLIKLDKTAWTATITRKTITGTPPFTDSGLTTTSRLQQRVSCALINNGTHLAVLNGRAYSTTTINTAYYRLYIYRITGDDPNANLTYVTSYDYSTKKPYGIIDMTTQLGTKLALVHDTGVDVLQFDGSGSGAYNTVATYPITCISVGVDFVNRLWMMDASYAIYCVTPGQTVKINAELEEQAYTFTGTNISTNVIVSAVDDSNAKVVKSVALVVEYGNASFSGGARTTVVTTNAGSDLSVPLTITGGGAFSITASEVV